MIVGFQVIVIGLLADMISGNRKLLEDLLYRVRQLELPQTRPRRNATAGARRRKDDRWSASSRGRSVSGIDRHPCVQRSGRHRRRRRRRSARRGAAGTRSSSSTTARATGPAQRASAPGRVVVRHPYNKGNGAAVKSGIRRATGEFVLIIDGDGQHRPEDARRLVSRLGEYDLVIGARAATTQATQARRVGNAALNRLASYLTGRRDSGPDVRVPRRAPRVPARVPSPAAERVLDADDDDAGVHQGRVQRRVRADRSAVSGSASRRSASRVTARSS